MSDDFALYTFISGGFCGLLVGLLVSGLSSIVTANKLDLLQGDIHKLAQTQMMTTAALQELINDVNGTSSVLNGVNIKSVKLRTTI